MKKVLFLAAVLVLSLGLAKVRADEGGSADNGKFIWGIGLGVAGEGNGFSAGYSLGYGLDTDFGFKLDSHWDALLGVDFYLFNTNLSGFSSNEFNFIPSLRYTFGTTGTRPYVLAGLGLNDNTATMPSASTASMVLAGGAGLLFPGGQFNNRDFDFYIQLKYEEVLTTQGNFSYFPLSAGVQFN